MTKTHSLQATLALASGGSAPSRYMLHRALIAYSLTKNDLVALVAVLIAFGSGVAAGVYAMRFFGVDDNPLGRRLVFWPTVWIVGALVFVVAALVLAYLTGGFHQTP